MTAETWRLYKRQPGFVLGFHGCDASVGEAVLSGKKWLEPSENRYDWLGSGIYFWEGNPGGLFSPDPRHRPAIPSR